MKDKLDIEDKKAWVQGLLVDCPVGKSLDTCLAKGLRLLPIKTRLGLVREMDEGQINQIIAHHETCLLEREQIKTEGMR
jgi:hypothetical protein